MSLTTTQQQIFLKDCLNHLQNSDHARNRFWSILKLEIPKSIDEFLKSNKEYQIIFIQVLLSCTADGKAVMPFLDEKNKQYKQITNLHIKYTNVFPDVLKWASVKMQMEKEGETTIQFVLLQAFIRAYFGEGKEFEKAYQILNKEYIDQVYA